MCTNAIVDFSGKMLTDEDIRHRTRDLLKLISEHDKLKSFRKDEAFLLRFLHCSDFDVTLALKKLEDFINYLFKYPNWFASTSPLHIKNKFEFYDKAITKDRDKKGRAIMVMKLEKMDVANSSPPEQAHIVDMWLESILDDPITQANGLSVIVDMKGYSWGLLKWFTPTNMKNGAGKIDVYPIKEILYHIVNTSFLINATVKLLWPFLNDKLRNMFKFHYDNWPSLHEYISPDVLPAEYGGNGPDIDFQKSVETLFDQDSSIGAKLMHYRISNQ
ncbi:hypothetical protein ILUMI_04857 [Ignelater luminosus]|uniref:CRAL-TRIO domain-containing protein n=1 Tax=Ignelater luminosus TaxID=2038154 RepID=A0A8K0D8V0_IGNLU|nr:hypothetical protein ILUMI_04857 [Ignelater luminosus]